MSELRETAAEITGGGRIGNPLGSHGVEIGFVAASIFEVLEAVAAGEQVHRDVEDMIGFVVGQVQLEQRNRSIDFLSQVESLWSIPAAFRYRPRRWLAACRRVRT